MQRLPWELLFTYTPYPDEAEHLWRGFLEPTLPGFRPELAKQLQPLMEEVYRSCDVFLGMLLQSRSAETVIALVSDHGMEGVNRAVRINVALRRAGLLVLDRDGRVDLSKTQALYPSGDNAYVLINTTDRKGGIVALDERARVVERVRDALKEIRDSGRAVVTDVLDAATEGEARGFGGPAGGDIYLDLAPGYDFDPQVRGDAWIVTREPYGSHGFSPARRSMRTIMVFNGPGVAAGQKLAAARAIDFAPTLARLLALDPPRHATGRVLQEVLAP
jgi:predicted AlkP superfamily phosphohydrolase/phosphomutase